MTLRIDRPIERVTGKALLALTILASVALVVPRAYALSEIPQEEVQPPPTGDTQPIETKPLPPIGTPDTTTPPPADGSETAPPADGTLPPAGDTAPPADDTTSPPDETPPADESQETPPAQTQPEGPPPEVIYDLSRLPAPAKRMRELIIEAAVSGNLEKLRPLIGSGDTGTQLSLGGVDGDPIEFLRGISGDPDPGEGQEILAILEEVLSAGFVHLDAGTPEEMYVWPYFYGLPLEGLTPPQRVELFKIVTAGDYEDMKSYGAYTFYRAGITKEGQWSFFLAGD